MIRSRFGQRKLGISQGPLFRSRGIARRKNLRKRGQGHFHLLRSGLPCRELLKQKPRPKERLEERRFRSKLQEFVRDRRDGRDEADAQEKPAPKLLAGTREKRRMATTTKRKTKFVPQRA